MRKIIFLSILLIVKISFGQEEEGFVSTNNTTTNVEEGNAIRTFDNRYEGVKGHPYLLEDSKPLTIFLKGDTLKAIGNINIYTEELLLIKKSIHKIPLSKVEGVLLENNYLKNVLIEGKHRLLSKIFENQSFNIYSSVDKTLQEASYTGAYAAGKTQDEFKTKTLVWKEEGGGIERFQMKSGTLAELFQFKAKKVKSILNANKLNAKNPDDYSKIFTLLSEG